MGVTQCRRPPSSAGAMCDDDDAGSEELPRGLRPSDRIAAEENSDCDGENGDDDVRLFQ